MNATSGCPRVGFRLRVRRNLPGKLLLGCALVQAFAAAPEIAPGHVYLEGDSVVVLAPTNLSAAATFWQVRTDQPGTVVRGTLAHGTPSASKPVALGKLGPGWYRVEFGTSNEPCQAWTTAAVLPRRPIAASPDSPVALDAAVSWFAANDPDRQAAFARLAALAGAGWVRDRLRWRDVQPNEDVLVPPATTYDTAAELQHRAGLRVLQVFHDTPPWARESSGEGGRFAPDLRHVHRFARDMARRWQGRVQAWEPWNEANVATFGAHTVDQMCSWQKAAWLGFKAGDSNVIVGWNATAAVPTPPHTEGVLANECWPYFDTYNIHTYDWHHSYLDLWEPARRAACGRPLWITEADRGTPHRKDPPWFDQDPILERLKAEWMAQAYTSSLFAGATRHFHFILGHYHEPNGVQFGLLRLDLTPRPAYVALAAVGRFLADARPLGRCRMPGSQDLHVYAFRAKPDGQPRDVLVVWAERETDWGERGRATAVWVPPSDLSILRVTDYLGRDLHARLPNPVTSAPCFVELPSGQAERLELIPPAPVHDAPRKVDVSPLVLQLSLAKEKAVRVEDRPWSEGYAWRVSPGTKLELPFHAYNFGSAPARLRIRAEQHPAGWSLTPGTGEIRVPPEGRVAFTATLAVPEVPAVKDGWAVVRGEAASLGSPVLAARFVVAD